MWIKTAKGLRIEHRMLLLSCTSTTELREEGIHEAMFVVWDLDYRGYSLVQSNIAGLTGMADGKSRWCWPCIRRQNVLIANLSPESGLARHQSIGSQLPFAAIASPISWGLSLSFLTTTTLRILEKINCNRRLLHLPLTRNRHFSRLLLFDKHSKFSSLGSPMTGYWYHV